MYGPLAAHHHCHFHRISLLPIHRHIKPLVHGKGLKEQQNSTSCSDAILHFHAQAQLLRSIYVADFIPVHSKFQSSSESSPHPFQVIVLPPLLLDSLEAVHQSKPYRSPDLMSSAGNPGLIVSCDCFSHRSIVTCVSTISSLT